LFAQFGAGSLAGASTLLSKYVIINPFNLNAEENKLSQLINNPFENLFIDENALVSTFYHRAVNRLIENSKGESKHGSCGHGVWEAKLDYLNNPKDCIFAKDLNKKKVLREKLCAIRDRMVKRLDELNIDLKDEKYVFMTDFDRIAYEYNMFAEKVNIISSEESCELIKNSKNPVFEGNQGIGIDENYGFFPYVTATDTTSKNALRLLNECNWTGEKEVIGVSRTYTTRHGAGPFVTEDESLNKILGDKFNVHNIWQGNLKFGWLDLNLLKYSIKIDGHIDSLAITHVDELKKLDNWKICDFYENFNKVWQLTKPNFCDIVEQENLTYELFRSHAVYQRQDKNDVLKVVEHELNKKIRIKSFGAKSNEKELIN
jgi:adenylosuccinate synthase